MRQRKRLCGCQLGQNGQRLGPSKVPPEALVGGKAWFAYAAKASVRTPRPTPAYLPLYMSIAVNNDSRCWQPVHNTPRHPNVTPAERLWLAKFQLHTGRNATIYTLSLIGHPGALKIEPGALKIEQNQSHLPKVTQQRFGVWCVQPEGVSQQHVLLSHVICIRHCKSSQNKALSQVNNTLPTGARQGVFYVQYLVPHKCSISAFIAKQFIVMHRTHQFCQSLPHKHCMLSCRQPGHTVCQPAFIRTVSSQSANHCSMTRHDNLENILARHSTSTLPELSPSCNCCLKLVPGDMA